ncbi:MAG TPA: DUF5825 family protein [Mycobacteriales bacterium]|nr:DUF5825 family protein [Mycobacteriales bacterium]
MTTMLAGLRLRLWREHDEALLTAPGMAMGEWSAPGLNADLAGAVEQLYRDGVRRVAFDRPVDLTGDLDAATLVQAMVLLGELTSWAIVVDWELLVGAHLDVWQRLNHLHPPRQLPDHPDAEEVLADWRGTFYLCKCIYRQGPGFVQVRDRRSGSLARFTIDVPEYLTAIETLLPGAPSAAVPAEVLAEFVAEGLAGTAGDLAWWLPYRVRRWPYPSMIV